MNIGRVLYEQTEIYQISEKEPVLLDLAPDCRVLFIASDTEQEPYLAEYANFINNVFLAVKLKDTSYQIVALKQATSLQELYKYPNIQYIIFFGAAEKLVDYQFEFIRNRPLQLQHKQVLFTDKLAILSEASNKTQKNEFWAGLQRMFAVKN